MPSIIAVRPHAIVISGVVKNIEERKLYSKENQIFLSIENKKIFIRHSKHITVKNLSKFIGKNVSILCTCGISLNTGIEYYTGDIQTIMAKEA